MYCKQVVRRLLRQCGRKVTVQLPEGEISLTAYLNPLRERDDRLGFGESGMVQQGRWLLLAPWEEGEALSAGMVVTAAGEDFLLERVEKVYFQGEPAYVWGLAVREQEVEADG